MRSQGFVRGLFAGQVPEQLVIPYVALEDAELKQVHRLVAQFNEIAAQHIDAAVVDASGQLPQAGLEALAQAGFFGLLVPVEQGGLGLSVSAAARVLEEIASCDASVATLLYVHSAIGLRALQRFGSEEQRARLVPRLARGEGVVAGRGIAAFALTESGGTDAAGIRTYAEWAPARGRYVLQGSKPLVIGAERAEMLVLVARTTPPEHGAKPRLTAFLVEPSHGYVVRPRQQTPGLRALPVNEVVFDGVELPESARLGEVGRGYNLTQEVIDGARPLYAAITVGQMRSILAYTVKHAIQRRTQGRAIGEYPALQDKVTRIVADLFAVESMTYLATGLIDRGVADTTLESAICRVASVEALWRVVNDASQVVASRAYVAGAELDRWLRDARGGFVLDATNETVRSYIALTGLRGQSARAGGEPRPRRSWLRRAVAPERPEWRTELTLAHPLLAPEAQVFASSARSFAQATAELLRHHRADVAEMQTTHLRVANTAIDLLALAACIARVTREVSARGEDGARRKLDVTRMFAAAAERRMRANIAGMGHNDDSLRRVIAARIYADRGYPFDVI